jgi:uncharacterized membrane protein YdjX (TVP38/TMEM64 family)
MRREGVVAGGVVAAVAAAALVSSPAVVLDRLSWLAADPLRLLAALVALAAVRPFLAWPTTLLAVAAGYGFGPAGAPVALALMTLTGVPPYLLARRGRRGFDRAAAAGERLVDAAGDARSVAAGRLFPTPSDAVSVGAGVAGVPLRPFLLGTVVGEAPWAVAGALAGSEARALASGRVALGDVFDPRLVVAVALLGALLLARPAARALR